MLENGAQCQRLIAQTLGRYTGTRLVKVLWTWLRHRRLSGVLRSTCLDEQQNDGADSGFGHLLKVMAKGKSQLCSCQAGPG